MLLIVAGLVLALAGAPAGGKSHKKRPGWGTRVTLSHPSSTRFAGTVKSKLRSCRTQRLVNLYYVDPFTGQRQPLFVQRAGKRGKYRVTLSQPAFGGNYQAQAPKVRKGGRLLCRGDRSNLVAVATVSPAP